MLIEVLSWLVAVVIVFVVMNFFFGCKRFASLFLAFFIASTIIFVVFDSKLAEALLTLSIVIGLIYAFIKAITDKRRDMPYPHDLGGDPITREKDKSV